jgi:GT2 family glycosyltransferase
MKAVDERGVLLDYYSQGAFEGRDPNPFFNSSWYMKQYFTPLDALTNPLVHYMRWGARDGLNPSPAFDAQYYVAKYKQAKDNALLHFLEFGLARGYQTSASPQPNVKGHVLIREPDAGLAHLEQAARAFDAEFYLQEYPDVVRARVDPLRHYLDHGGLEGRRPNRYFDSFWYLQRYADVVELGQNPLVHYMSTGAAEGRQPFAAFDPQYYISQNPEAEANPLLHYMQIGRNGDLPIYDPIKGPPQTNFGASTASDARELLRGIFDPAFYLSEYPDVAHAGMDALEHYLEHGGFEGRNPNAWFDSEWYFQSNKDLTERSINPLLHYMNWGAPEGRDPSPNFDAAYYITAYKDAAANPLRHYMLYGREQGYKTTKEPDILDYLPAKQSRAPEIPDVDIDIIIPVYKGISEVQDCLRSLLEDSSQCFSRIIIIDDKSPEPEVSQWLREFCPSDERIHLLSNEVNLGFVGTVNRGIRYSERNDVVLLNSDTMVPDGWLQRLRGHAYGSDKIATVTPFSNNATICSYPSAKGGPMPFGLNLSEIDEATARVNRGRSVSVPTGVGFCMYVRRQCLDEVGLLDEARFGKGYGEEVDFCKRSGLAGWDNRLACDLFVYHAGEVSFGKNSPHLAAGQRALQELYPDFNLIVDRHVRRDEVASYRFCLSAELLFKSKKPKLLHITHNLGGGIERHIHDISRVVGKQAIHLVLSTSPLGFTLSIPSMLDIPLLSVNTRDFAFLIKLLKLIKLDRIHIHHALGAHPYLKRLVQNLKLPFDFTVHDFHTVCPTINFLPFSGTDFCGQPSERHCNNCIRLSQNSAYDIDTWRLEHEWLLKDAGRLIAPSEDTRRRLAIYHPALKVMVINHDFTAVNVAEVTVPRRQDDGRIRIGLVGVLSEHKGLSIVRAALKQSSESKLDFILIGHSEAQDELVLLGLEETGEYDDEHLGKLIHDADLDVLWYPARWPETYSYTLTAGLQTKLPIVATDIGAFPERLRNRRGACLIDVTKPASEWIARTMRLMAETQGDYDWNEVEFAADAGSIKFYADDYVPEMVKSEWKIRKNTSAVRKVLIVPELLANGAPTPCAYIRLILPFRLLQKSLKFELELGRPEDIGLSNTDLVVTHRHAARNVADAKTIVSSIRKIKARFLYDLDDQLITVSEEHPEYAMLHKIAATVKYLTASADTLWVSTQRLGEQVGSFARQWSVCENGLGAELWEIDRKRTYNSGGVIRIGYMGTATHIGDFSIIAPVAERVKRRFGERVKFEIIGVTAGGDMPSGFERIAIPQDAVRSYPLFVSWFRNLPLWDIGLAPLQHSPFNSGKSAIKSLDYAAAGIPTLASRHDVYRGSIADGEGGMLLGDSADEWEEAICRLVASHVERRRLGDAANAALQEKFTLEAQYSVRRRLFEALFDTVAEQPLA